MNNELSDEIKTKAGQIAGSWDGADVADLQRHLDRIRTELRESSPQDRLIPAGIPHRDQLPDDLQNFSAYPIWGCDRQAQCLCGARANRVVSIEDVRQFSMIDHH